LHDLKTKTVIDERFEILDRIGTGGMGAVYKAQQIGLDRVVALKLMLPHLLDDANGLARFELEAQALSSLRHRNICLFYAYGIWHGRAPYIVMEYLDTDDLSDLLTANGRLSWRRAARVCCQIAQAVGHAHSAKILHRDLKPGNVFVLADADGDVIKVGDFGLAKFVDETPQQKLTATGMSVGTPHYMSPEQAIGMPATNASDIYSLGCILYQCLFGCPPFQGDSMTEILAKHADAPVPLPPRKDLECLPKEIVDAVETAMAKDPAKRFATMADFAEALRKAEHSALPDCKAPAAPAPQGTSHSSRSAAIRNRLLFGVSAGFILLLGFMFNVYLFKAIAGFLSSYGDAATIGPTVAVANFFKSRKAVDQAAPLYDAAINLAHRFSDPFQKTQIALDEAAMYKRAKREDLYQTALDEVATDYVAALKSQSFLHQPQAKKEWFVDSSSKMLYDWNPSPLVQSNKIQYAWNAVLDAGVWHEVLIARAISFKWSSPLEHNLSATTERRAALAYQIHIDEGPLSVRRDAIRYFEETGSGPMLKTKTQIRELTDAAVAAAERKEEPQAIDSLTQIYFHFCLYDSRHPVAEQLCRAAFAIQPIANSRFGRTMLAETYRALWNYMCSPPAAESRVEYCKNAIANEQGLGLEKSFVQDCRKMLMRETSSH
jgi:serine/threonine protein kinase